MIPLPHWPGYAVDADGNVFSFWRTLPPKRGLPRIHSVIVAEPRRVPDFDRMNRKKQPSGYRSVCLSRGGVHRNFYVHELVLRAFVGERPTPDHEALHRNGERADNRLKNLRWGTVLENAEDRRLHALAPWRDAPFAEIDASPDSHGGCFSDFLAAGAA